jgi:hypothetical protein
MSTLRSRTVRVYIKVPLGVGTVTTLPLPAYDSIRKSPVSEEDTHLNGAELRDLVTRPMREPLCFVSILYCAAVTLDICSATLPRTLENSIDWIFRGFNSMLGQTERER